MRHLKRGLFFSKMPMLLPHEMFSAIWHHYPVMFDRMFGTIENAKGFWAAVEGGPHFRWGLFCNLL